MLLSAEIIDPPPPGLVCLPRTQEEIACAAEDVFRIDWPFNFGSLDSASHLKFLIVCTSVCPECALANDMVACRDAARKMRLAGVAMPAPLLALTALDPKFFEAQPQ